MTNDELAKENEELRQENSRLKDLLVASKEVMDIDMQVQERLAALLFEKHRPEQVSEPQT